jgi:hypothetical protein
VVAFLAGARERPGAKRQRRAGGVGEEVGVAAGAGGAVKGMGLGLRQMTGINEPSEAEVQDYQDLLEELR